MSFANPTALLLLSLISIPIFMSFFRIKPIKKTVSSILIWLNIKERAPAIKEAKSVKISLSVIFQILAIVFGSTALAGPFISEEIPKPLHVVLVVDTSMSMATKHKEKTRLAYVIDHAQDIIKKLSENDRVTLVTSTMPSVSGTSKSIVSKLDQLKVGYQTVDIFDSALHFQDALVVIFTDKTYDNAIVIGEKSNNKGIVEFSIEEDEQLTIYAKILDLSVNSRIPIELLIDNKKYSEALETSKKHTAFVRRFDHRNVNRVELKMLTDDNFSYDDRVVAAKMEYTELKACIIGKDDEYLVKAISINGVSLEKATKENESHQLAIYYNSSPQELNKNYYCIVDPNESNQYLSVGEKFKPTSLVTATNLMQHVQFNGLEFPFVRKIEVKDMKPILFADGKVIGALDSTGKVLVLGIDITNWKKVADSFSIFWANYVSYVKKQLDIKSGFQAFKMGSTITLDKERFFLQTYGDTILGKNKIYVNLLDEEESDNDAITKTTSLDIPKDYRYSMKRTKFDFFLIGLFAMAMILSWILEK